ncbi:hypothetical protein VUR80DRAFT_407 [Thermomyces stellatus]
MTGSCFSRCRLPDFPPLYFSDRHVWDRSTANHLHHRCVSGNRASSRDWEKLEAWKRVEDIRLTVPKKKKPQKKLPCPESNQGPCLPSFMREQYDSHYTTWDCLLSWRMSRDGPCGKHRGQPRQRHPASRVASPTSRCIWGPSRNNHTEPTAEIPLQVISIAVGAGNIEMPTI